MATNGARVDCLRRALRDAAAKRLFRKALTDPSHPQPHVINTDQARLYGSAILTLATWPHIVTKRTIRAPGARPFERLGYLGPYVH